MVLFFLYNVAVLVKSESMFLKLLEEHWVALDLLQVQFVESGTLSFAALLSLKRPKLPLLSE